MKSKTVKMAETFVKLIILTALTAIAIAGQTESAADEQPSVETVVLDKGVEMKFVYIEAGTFIMGTNNAAPGEGPAHEVTLTQDFEIGQTEVTQAQWYALMKNDSRTWLHNPSYTKNCPQCPVDMVAWIDVVEFIKKLNALNDGYNYRLPTEAEWEYACRAGTTTTWSFGNDAKLLDQYAWQYDSQTGKNRPVATKKPNPWGLYDMHGNVAEWVQDYWSRFTKDAVTDPTGPATGSDPRFDHLSSRVIRGAFTESYSRSTYLAGERVSRFGFRVVRQSIEEPEQ